MPEEWSLDDAIRRYFDNKFDDGDLLSHDWIRWALDITDNDLERNEFILLERMDAFRTVLLNEHQIALQNIRGKGYRVIPPAEQAHYAAAEAARYLAKGMRRAGDLLTNTRMDVLTRDEQRRHTDVQIRIAGLKGMISKGKRDVFALFVPQDGN